MVETNVRWIVDDVHLAEACQQWRQCAFVALDTEFMRVDTFYPLAALVQVGDGEGIWLIDPLRIRDWSAFAALLHDSAVVKVLHSCGEDLEIFQRLTGAYPVPLFDTQLAAGYLGIGFSMGYSRLVHELLGVSLSKDETRSDWLQRPLTPMQIRYAADDVLHLCEVYRCLDARLDEERRRWLLDDGAELVAAHSDIEDPQEAWREVRLAWKLRPQQLAVLRALSNWREEQARKRNVPRSRLMKDGPLWMLARYQPKDLAGLARIEELPPRTLRHDATELLAIMSAAAALPAEQWPETLVEPLPPEVSRLLKALRAVGQREAERLNIVPELMLRKKSLEALIRSGYPQGPYHLPDSLRGWRRERMGQALLDTLHSLS